MKNKLRKKRVYLAGPITGVENYKENFKIVEDELMAAGYIVINPAVLPEGLDYEEYFSICFEMINKVDMLVLLPKWEDSKGVKRELVYAKKIGIPAIPKDSLAINKLSKSC